MPGRNDAEKRNHPSPASSGLPEQVRVDTFPPQTSATSSPATEGPPSGPQAFETLYAQHSREVWAIAYARWMDADLALDITQEAFLRLWKHWESASEVIQNPRAWLLRVARNLAEDQAKSAFRRNGTQAPQWMHSVQTSERPPLEQLLQAETFARLRTILEQMPPGDRDILTLRYALDYDASQIADLLGIQVTAVHMRLSRARQRLAERLTAEGVDEAL